MSSEQNEHLRVVTKTGADCFSGVVSFFKVFHPS